MKSQIILTHSKEQVIEKIKTNSKMFLLYFITMSVKVFYLTYGMEMIRHDPQNDKYGM
jgi:hypothetical protein